MLPDLEHPHAAVLKAKQPALTDDKATFSDAKGLDGSFKMPDLASLKFVKGELRETAS